MLIQVERIQRPAQSIEFSMRGCLCKVSCGMSTAEASPTVLNWMLGGLCRLRVELTASVQGQWVELGARSISQGLRTI